MLKKKAIITIIGGSGFLGTYVIRHLAPLGVRIQIIARHASLKAAQLKVAGYVGQIAFIDADAQDTEQLEKCISKSDYVINLVGVLFSRGKQNFDALHYKLPDKVASLCKKYKVKKLIHVSALGVDKALSSPYAQSKMAGERAVLQHYPSAIIIRPSVMFGPEDGFINLFNRLSKISPILPLIGGGANKMQPVYVDDVARVIVKCLTDEISSLKGQVIEVAGPTQYTFREIIEYIIHTKGRRRIMLSVPFIWAKFKAFFLEMLPKPLFTRDQVELLKYDNVLSGENGLEALAITPTPMEVVLPTYLE